MEGRFVNAFTLLPKQRVICGYQTRPISLRHRLMLTHFQSPFATGDMDVLPIHVLVAAKVLSCKDLSMLGDPKPTALDVEWVQKMTENHVLFEHECTKIIDSIQEQALWPVFWKKKLSTNEHGVPWILATICNLVRHGVPMEDAWTMPESQAVWMATTFSITDGSKIDIISDKDVAAMEYLRAMKEQAEKAKAEQEQQEAEEAVEENG